MINTMSNEVKLLELKPNQKLLDASFDGYKLSLDPISKIKFPLVTPPHKIEPSEEQYSSLHAQLFSLQNHLVRDPWSANTTYFADANRNIQHIKYNEESAKLEPLTSVYRLRQCERSSADYNISFTFISEKYCVLSDGIGILYLIDTDDRYVKSEWKSVYSEYGLEEKNRFHVQDARFEIENGKKNVYCMLLHVEYLTNSFETVLNLVRLTQEENGGWVKSMLKEIKLKNLPTYCSLEPRSSAIVLCTDRAINLNSANAEEQAPSLLQSNIELDAEQSSFAWTWTQSDEEIFIKFKFCEEFEKQNFRLVYDRTSINVTYKDEVLLNGKLCGEIDSDLTTWTLDTEHTGDQYVQVTLMKKETPQSKWKNLLDSLSSPEFIDEEVKSDVQRFDLTSVLQSEMEDCDMDINDVDSDHNLLRIDPTLFTITHKLNLGSHRPLFNVHQRPGSLPAIVIRSDVDALIWVPKFTISNPSDWSLSHEATLNAFGYVQASKQQKKYMQCSPNAEYSVICEPHRHVFIYKMSNSSAIGLKKRSGGKVSIGQQKLFSLDEQDEIVGIVVEDEITTLLTEKYIFVLQINA